MVKLLNLPSFQRKLIKYPVFTPLDVQRELGLLPTTALKAINRYRRRGLIEQLRRGLYVMADAHLPDPYIANRLYQPSYVSLEFALSWHGVIPETVYSITSVTPKATQTFTVRGTTFTFRRLKKNVFTGYRILRQGGISFALAEPEKAFVDLAYYRWRSGAAPLDRFRRETLNRAKIMKYARLFQQPRLTAIISAQTR